MGEADALLLNVEVAALETQITELTWEHSARKRVGLRQLLSAALTRAALPEEVKVGMWRHLEAAEVALRAGSVASRDLPSMASRMGSPAPCSASTPATVEPSSLDAFEGGPPPFNFQSAKQASVNFQSRLMEEEEEEDTFP